MCHLIAACFPRLLTILAPATFPQLPNSPLRDPPARQDPAHAFRYFPASLPPPRPRDRRVNLFPPPHEQPGKLRSAHHRRQRCHPLNFTTIRQTFADGDERVLVHIPSPNTRDTCTVFPSLAISPDLDGLTFEPQIDFAIQVLDEDHLMCENQIPAEAPPLNPARDDLLA